MTKAHLCVKWELVLVLDHRDVLLHLFRRRVVDLAELCITRAVEELVEDAFGVASGGVGTKG